MPLLLNSLFEKVQEHLVFPRQILKALLRPLRDDPFTLPFDKLQQNKCCTDIMVLIVDFVIHNNKVLDWKLF